MSTATSVYSPDAVSAGISIVVENKPLLAATVLFLV